MIVAVTIVWVMQMTVDQVVYMISVRNPLMTAIRPVRVARIMFPAIVLWRAGSRITSSGRNLMIVDMIAMHMVHVAVVKIVGVVVVAHSRVSAIRTMSMRMTFVLGARSRHDSLCGRS